MKKLWKKFQRDIKYSGYKHGYGGEMNTIVPGLLQIQVAISIIVIILIITSFCNIHI